MGAFNWFKRLRGDERGNVLVVGAATLPLLMGSAALAIDTVQLSLWKRQLQRAADSAAIAGAYALAQGAPIDPAVANDIDEHIDFDLEENEKPMLTNREITPGTFANQEISSDSCADRGISPCYGRAVRVALTAERTLPFMRLFTSSSNQITASGTAALVGDGEYCLVSLYNGTSPGIVASGNATLALGCGIATNSRATNAVSAGGSSEVTASPIAAVGGIAGGSQFKGNPVLQPYVAPVVDPFADVPDPVAPGGCDTNSKLSVSGNSSVTLQDGACFGSWDVKGTVNLTSGGTYYVNGGLLDINGLVTGENVTIVLLGDGSDLTQSGGGRLSITAPAEGPTKGIAVYRDRNAATNVIKLNGGAETNVTGAFYMKSTDIWINGNTAFNAQCLQLVGRILTFKGTGNIQNNCGGTGSGAVKRTVVRLLA